MKLLCERLSSRPLASLVPPHSHCAVVFCAQSQTTMVLESAVSQVSQVADTIMLLASKETDFGGYTGPATGLVILGLLISFLTNPYDDLKTK